MGQFPEFEPNLDLPALDREVLDLWREHKVFQRSVDQRAGAEPFVFYEGPPTANGRPGVHHVEARTFKDLFPRFQTMRGRRVDRKGGWDCHGLPVELEIEKELGLAHKRDVEAYGVAEFNARCRESVKRYVDVWQQLTDRVGFWLDTDQAYWTMNPEYVESVWWALATLHRKGLLYEDYKVVPYCPRCGTALSDAEVAMGYQEVDDPSVYVVFPVTSGRLAQESAGLLVWTTTPWTLLSNAGVAAGPGIRYVLAEARTPHGGADPGSTRRLVVAADLVEQALGPEATVLREVPMDELAGTTYRRPFEHVPVDAEAAASGWRVVTADFVTTADGTGLVHLAPAFGAEDLAVGRRAGLPVLHPVDAEGAFTQAGGPFAGQQVKAADPAIVEELRDGGLLWRAQTYRHDYPHCWRCHTPLLYYALTSWYARTTAVKDRMLAENQRIGWQPEHIRDGRFGDWLEHNVDWALSRARYWGTPLPLWRCAEGHVTAVASRAELGELTGRDLSGLDPHRPFVDEVAFACPQCGTDAARVPDVLDAWFDSGSMPFAQWGYPAQGDGGSGGREPSQASDRGAHGSEAGPPVRRSAFQEAFPADFISEAIDQTRGWFYSLLAVNVLLFDQAPYRNVVCLGHIVDEDGRKMSKSLGNVLDPFTLLDTYGADPLRWFMLATGSPWSPRRLGPGALAEITRSPFLTLWNTASFFSMYARLEDFDPAAPPAGEPDELDRWILGELDRTVREVTGELDRYDSSASAQRIAAFVDDLSNWYVRLSRRRFWRGAEAGDAAFRTLHTSLRTLALLLAPYAPFVAEALWQRLVVPVEPGVPDSVHLADWPEPSGAWDEELAAAMAEVRRLVGLGRQARTEAKVKVRQPLARAVVTVAPGRRAAVERLLGLVAAELNVKRVEFADGTQTLVDYRLAPAFRALGPRFGGQTGAVAGAVKAADAATLGPVLNDGGQVELDVPGLGPVTLGPDEVEVHEVPRTGWRVTAEGAASVALDLELTPELRREGLARDLVRGVQDLRKSAGLAVEDRIELAVEAEGAGGGQVAQALATHAEWVQAETLATTLHQRAPGDGPAGSEANLELDDGGRVRLWLRPVPRG